MSVEKHAEAAANDIGETPTSTLGTVEHIIARHIQSAIDEALAEKMIGVLDNASNHVHEVDLLKARIDELETLNQGYRLRCHSAERDAASSNRAIEQWKESDAILREKVKAAKARIAKLEGLGPLIEEMEREVFDAVLSGRDVDTDPAWAVTKSQIHAILKGES